MNKRDKIKIIDVDTLVEALSEECVDTLYGDLEKPKKLILKYYIIKLYIII